MHDDLVGVLAVETSWRCATSRRPRDDVVMFVVMSVVTTTTVYTNSTHEEVDSDPFELSPLYRITPRGNKMIATDGLDGDDLMSGRSYHVPDRGPSTFGEPIERAPQRVVLA
jgi:hypothetical protein